MLYALYPQTPHAKCAWRLRWLAGLQQQRKGGLAIVVLGLLLLRHAPSCDMPSGGDEARLVSLQPVAVQVLATTDSGLRALPKELLPLAPSLLVSYDLPTRKVRALYYQV